MVSSVIRDGFLEEMMITYDDFVVRQNRSLPSREDVRGSVEREEFVGKGTKLWGVRKHSMVWQLQTTRWDWSIECEGTVVGGELRSESRERL